mgnify:CR=1
ACRRATMIQTALLALSVVYGNTAGAEILEGDVWGALKIEHAVANHDSNGYCWPSLW